MGLDAVELVLRAEEFYSVEIEDLEAAQVRTVADFYGLICSKLEVMPVQTPQTPTTLPVVAQYERVLLVLRKHAPLPPPPEVLPWTGQSVWDSLVALIADQLGLKPRDILYTARFVEDLGVD